MSEDDSSAKCPHCGNKHARMLGICKICWQPVCLACGNRQATRGLSSCIHIECFEKHPEVAISDFKYIKFRKD